MKYLVLIMLYLVLLIVVGLYLSKKKVKTSDDLAVAGRSLPLPILIGTLLATWCGGGGITGSASMIYNYGPYVGLLYFIGAPIGIIILYFIAGKIRRTTTYTIPELFELRYGTTARILATVCIFLGYVGIIASQFKAAGNVLMLTTNMSLNQATLIVAIFIVFLTVIGGMVTVAYTDALSALFMVGGFAIAIPLLFSKVGGIGYAFSNLPAGKDTWTGSLSTIQLIGYMLPTTFLILGDQNMLQRFSAAKDSKTAKASNLGMFIAESVVIVLIILVVVAGIFLIPDLQAADTVIFLIALEHLPFIVGALVLIGAMAFVVTTADSYILSTASNVTYDIWFRFIKPDATDKEKMRFLRITMVVISILGFGLALYFPSILSIQMYAYTMYGAAITPALFCALFFKKATKIGGICGILSGGIITIVWEVLLSAPYGIKSALISVPAAFLVIIIVSLLTQNTEKTDINALYANEEQ